MAVVNQPSVIPVLPAGPGFVTVLPDHQPESPPPKEPNVGPDLSSCRASYPTLANLVESCMLFGVGVETKRAQTKCCGFLSGWVGPGAPGEGCVCGDKRINDLKKQLLGTSVARIFGVNTEFLQNV